MCGWRRYVGPESRLSSNRSMAANACPEVRDPGGKARLAGRLSWSRHVRKTARVVSEMCGSRRLESVTMRVVGSRPEILNYIGLTCGSAVLRRRRLSGRRFHSFERRAGPGGPAQTRGSAPRIRRGQCCDLAARGMISGLHGNLPFRRTTPDPPPRYCVLLDHRSHRFRSRQDGGDIRCGRLLGVGDPLLDAPCQFVLAFGRDEGVLAGHFEISMAGDL